MCIQAVFMPLLHKVPFRVKDAEGIKAPPMLRYPYQHQMSWEDDVVQCTVLQSDFPFSELSQVGFVPIQPNSINMFLYICLDIYLAVFLVSHSSYYTYYVSLAWRCRTASSWMKKHQSMFLLFVKKFLLTMLKTRVYVRLCPPRLGVNSCYCTATNLQVCLHMYKHSMTVKCTQPYQKPGAFFLDLEPPKLMF